MLEADFKTLRVAKDSGPEEIEKAYIRLVRRYPPEHFPEKFTAIRSAYRTLTLGEEKVEEWEDKLRAPLSSAAFMGMLWGDREEIKTPPPADLSALASLIDAERWEKNLSDILEEASRSGLFWLGCDSENEAVGNKRWAD